MRFKEKIPELPRGGLGLWVEDEFGLENAQNWGEKAKIKGEKTAPKMRGKWAKKKWRKNSKNLGDDSTGNRKKK